MKVEAALKPLVDLLCLSFYLKPVQPKTQKEKQED